MKHIFVRNGIVAEISRVNPFGIFSEAYAFQFIPAPDEVQVGWIYDGSGFFAPPEPEPEYPKFYGNAKLDLFTIDEQMVVVTATMTDPVVKLIYDRLLNAAYFSYESPEAEEGLTALVAKGLLTQNRKEAIVKTMTAT